MKEKKLVSLIIKYFEENIFENHIKASLGRNAQLKSYKINPVVVQYLSKVLNDNFSAEGVAKALYYPRVLGTSINTIFGTQIQNMFVELSIAEGSMVKGMDIEFIDKLDGRKKWCQLKSGPNTINSEDVGPLLRKFSKALNLARTNAAFKGSSNLDFMVGVLYGSFDELSQHYRKIDEIHPVIAGKDFWHRITGYPEIYDDIVSKLHETILNIDTQNYIETGCEMLAEEVASSPLFSFE